MAPLLAAFLPLLGKTVEKVVDKVLPDPEKAAAAKAELAKLDLEKMVLEQEETKAFLADVASARERDVAFLQAGKRNVRGDILAYAAIGSLIGTVLLLFVFKVPEESRELLLVVLGALVAIVKDVFGFEFGSSKDSQRNAQAVADMLKNGS